MKKEMPALLVAQQDRRRGLTLRAMFPMTILSHAEGKVDYLFLAGWVLAQRMARGCGNWQMRQAEILAKYADKLHESAKRES